MSKKNKQGATVSDEKVRDAFMIKMISLAEWQVVSLKIQGDRVISQQAEEPNLPAIVWRKLGTKLRLSQK